MGGVSWAWGEGGVTAVAKRRLAKQEGDGRQESKVPDRLLIVDITCL